MCETRRGRGTSGKLPGWPPAFTGLSRFESEGTRVRTPPDPDVVGTGTETAVIRDGQLLEVDGEDGMIRVMESGN